MFESGESGIAVLLKPPGWEVDDEDKAPTGKRLSWYLQERYPRSSIVFDADHCFGIIHRLDVPSSGLILVGITYEGYYLLKWQLDTARIVREYVVLCHGWMSPTLREIDAPIYHQPTGGRRLGALWKGRQAEPSTISEMGKPAKTLIRVLAHLVKAQARHSLLVVRICTGRRHQIRAHLHHVNHPTVADGKYTPADVFSDDLSWCPRNFLHRQRLEFRDAADRIVEVVEPLPDDLREALRRLAAVDGRSDEVLGLWTAGHAPCAWDSYDILKRPHEQLDPDQTATFGGCGTGVCRYDMSVAGGVKFAPD